MIRPAADGLARPFAWLLIGAVVAVPVIVAAASPLQASRDEIWVLGGMSGVVALALLFLQPVLIGRFRLLKGLQERRWHRWIGAAIVMLVAIHIGGLYVTSPEDITDALLLVSPTPFALYGVIGLAGVILTTALALFRKRLADGVWQIAHTILAVAIVGGSVVHALLIEGAMGETTKLVLCLFLVAATTGVVLKSAFGSLKAAQARASRKMKEAAE
jgi:predicted ferric reductase